MCSFFTNAEIWLFKTINTFYAQFIFVKSLQLRSTYCMSRSTKIRHVEIAKLLQKYICTIVALPFNFQCLAIQFAVLYSQTEILIFMLRQEFVELRQTIWGNNEVLTTVDCTNPSKRSRYSNRIVSNSIITVTKPLLL